MRQKTALVTGITGQTGSYAAELLLEKGYKVYGMKRRTSTNTLENIKHIKNEITIIEGDLSDQISLNKIVKDIKPNELYSYGAQAHVKVSFNQPELTADISGVSVLRLLEAIREFSPTTRFYNSATSELFGGETGGPYNEDSLLLPRSPYGCAKLYAYHITKNYREAYNLYACSGLTFNHESPRRSEDYVSRKITMAAAKIKLGLQKQLALGNIEAKRDITHAKDIVIGQWLMMQQDKPKDYVLGSGVSVSIKQMLNVVFSHLNLDWNDYVVIDPQFYRPTEVNVLLADPLRAKQELGWQPKISWKELLVEMIENDLTLLKK